MASGPSAAQYQAAHRAAIKAVKDRVKRYVVSVWGSLTSWRDADIDRFVAAVVPVVLAGQAQAAALTDAYLASVASTTLGLPPRPKGINASDVSGEAVRNGTPPEDVYRRAGITVWTALAAGAALDAAVRAGGIRAEVAADTDIQLAVTHTSRLIMGGDSRIVGYLRTVDGRGCDLCRLAATQRYSREDLMPIHNRCSCGVEPIYGGHSAPPIDDFISDLALAVEDHGELGPVLAVEGQDFTSEDDF